jgi:hypothetical protein
MLSFAAPEGQGEDASDQQNNAFPVKVWVLPAKWRKAQKKS